MTEPEVSIYIALHYIKHALTDEDIHVSLDGAHIKTGNNVWFDIKGFLKEHGCSKLDSPGEGWQGEYAVEGYTPHIIITSKPGMGDINIQTLDGKTLLIESKKGNKKHGQEYPLMREAIGQLMTGGDLMKNIVPIVAVPYSSKSCELANRWIRLPQIKQAGIKFMLVREEGHILYIE